MLAVPSTLTGFTGIESGLLGADEHLTEVRHGAKGARAPQ